MIRRSIAGRLRRSKRIWRNKRIEIEKLQASLGEATSNADQLATALSESNVRCVELADEVEAFKRVGEVSKSDLADASEEVETLRLSSTRSENELQAASQEALDQANLADRLREECATLKSSLEAIESQCAEKDVTANELAKAHEELQARLQDEINHRVDASKEVEALRVSSTRSENELKSASQEAVDQANLADRLREECTDLKSSLEAIESQCAEKDATANELAKAHEELQARLQDEINHRVDVSKEVEALRLSSTRSENDLKTASQEAVDQANLAERLREECTALKSSLEAVENQCAKKGVAANELAKTQEKLDTRLREEIDRHALAAKEFESAIAERESQLVASQEEVSRLNAEMAEHAKASQLKVDEALSLLANEQTIHNQLKETAVEDWEELSSQASRLREQELKIDSLTEQLTEQMASSQQELAASLAVLEREKSSLAKVKEDARKREEDEQVLHRSQVETLEGNLADRTMEIEKLQMSLDEASSNADLMTASLEESNGRCQELAGELTSLKSVEEKSKTQLVDAMKELETLRVNATRSENELRAANEKIRETSDLADLLRDECAALKLSLKEVETQTVEKAGSVNDLAKAKEKLQTRLQDEIDKRVVVTKQFDAEIAERESQLAALQEEVARLNSELVEQTADAQRKLDDALSTLSDEQAMHARLKESTTGDGDELSSQASKLREQDSRIDSFRQQVTESEQKLAATVAMLEQEQASLAETRNAARESEEEIRVLDSKNSELQSSLESVQQQVQQVEQEFAETLELLKNEQELRANTVRELEANEKRIDELEKEVGTSAISAESNNKLVRKLVGYRKAYRNSKAVIESISVQKSEMSDLATEYLAMTRKIRHELDEERETTLRLKSELENVNRSEVDLENAEVKREVDRLAGAHVLTLKSQFEQKLKEKNQLIRELQERQVGDASIQ